MKDLLNINVETLKELGVLDWGYFEDSIPITLDHYNEWLKKDYHEPLGYMGDERASIRQNLNNYYPDFQSGLVFLFPYIKEKKALKQIETKKKMASYIYAFEGIDYHYVIKERLQKIVDLLNNQNELEYKFSIDAQPVLERDLAYKAGLGWFGKNAMIINQEYGSYFLITSILVNKKLNIQNTQNIETDHCGTCTKCIEACPTNAIEVETRSIISNKCISTFSIELFKEADPPKGYNEQDFIYGCDVCQDVCPWNTKPIEESTSSELSSDIHKLLHQTADLKNLGELKEFSNRGFKKHFGASPISRTGRVGFLKNLK
jgi:epoxyqueuosine reductase